MKQIYNEKNESPSTYILPLETKINADTSFINQGMVLVVIHLHYLDTVDVYMKYIKNIPEEIDIIITVSNEKIKRKLQEAEWNKKRNYKILEKKNRGRDISSFLVACRKEILKYEYVCFLHDKKEKEDFLKEDIAKWIRSLWENMIGSKEYINNILYTFHMNSQLGLLIPPFPFSEHFTFSIYTNPWQEDFFVTRDLANQMNLKCEIDHMRQPVTLGTAFWARVSALKKLFEREWRYEDFPDEPMDNDGTISHAIERILAYVAQDAEFETHWVLTDKYAAEEFDYMQMLLRKSFERLNQSLDIRNVFELNNYELRTEKLLSFIDRFERFYIYGAGVRGKRYCSFLKKFQKKPAGFLVSDKSKNANSVNGVPVYSLSEIELDEKCGIIIGVSEKYQDEILFKIKKEKKHFSNIYYQ